MSAVLQEHPRTGWTEYDAAVYLLRTPQIAHRLDPFIAPKAIAWTEIWRGPYWTLSHGEQILVRAAWSLWRGVGDEPQPVDTDGEPDDRLVGGARVGELIWTLDDANLERVITAIRIRRGVV